MIDLYPQEITRVLLNLISNGFYAAAKRKETGEEAFEPKLSATTKSLGNKVEIRIRDNGTGIPLEVRDKMFNPFFTTKPAGEGTGLGLSISHDIVVKQHGGSINVDSEPGAFAEFIITLPRESACAAHAFPPDERQPARDPTVAMARSTACSGVCATRCATTLWQSMQSIVRRSPLAMSAALRRPPCTRAPGPCASVTRDVRDGLTLGVDGDVFDLTVGSACQWMARPLEVGTPGRPRASAESCRFGIGLVVGVFTLDADDVAEVLASPMTGAAHLVRRTEIGHDPGTGRP